VSTPRDKRMTIDEVVATLEDGMTIGIGGWGPRRKPMALVRAILRSDLKDLTVVSWGGADVGLLARAGKIRRLVYAFVSLDTVPLEPNFQQARQEGTIPEVVEWDEGMFCTGLRAASERLPFLPLRAGLGSDVLVNNPDLKLVANPYEPSEEYVAVPALRLDVAQLPESGAGWAAGLRARMRRGWRDERREIHSTHSGMLWAMSLELTYRIVSVSPAVALISLISNSSSIPIDLTSTTRPGPVSVAGAPPSE
jgi:acyl CoA:acetate/3-ketoacid CoA transferase alpha subunit